MCIINPMSKLNITLIGQIDYSLTVDTADLPDTLDTTDAMLVLRWAKENGRVDLNTGRITNIDILHIKPAS